MKKYNSRNNDKLPATWWHEGSTQFVCKIGYKEYVLNRERVRDRAFQLLGTNYAGAVTKAINLQKDWRWTVNYFKTSFPHRRPIGSKKSGCERIRVSSAVTRT